MKNKTMLVLLVAVMMLFVACATHVHVVGNGPQGMDVEEARQWYVLWGLVPINEVDTQDMAEGATDYQIKTEAAPLDVVINIFTSYVSITSRTVTVTK